MEKYNVEYADGNKKKLAHKDDVRLFGEAEEAVDEKQSKQAEAEKAVEPTQVAKKAVVTTPIGVRRSARIKERMYGKEWFSLYFLVYLFQMVSHFSFLFIVSN